MASPIPELEKELLELIEAHLDFESFAQKYQERLNESHNKIGALLRDHGLVREWSEIDG